MFWAAPSSIIADVRSAIVLTNGQAGLSNSIGFFPTTRPAGLTSREAI